MDGYIKLHRKFRNWEWYSEPVVKIVFLHLLITANWDDSRYKGHEIKAGQTIITVNGLAEELGFSVKQVRRAMEKLERTGEISKKRANRFTVVTIENWGFYQGSDTDGGSQRAMKGQTEGKQRAVKGQTERKATSIYKEKKEEEYINSARARVRHGDGVSINRFIPPDVPEVKAYCMERGNNVDPERFVNFYEAKGWMVGKNKMKDWRAAVRNWERNGASKSTAQTTQQGRLDWIDDI